jgi:serine/threonine protein kinase/tetratricopeptide (TPR) repeat protein
MNEESLFAAALEKPSPAERQAFLEQACGNDVALRQRLERLLAADERRSGILEGQPPTADINPAQPGLVPGRIFAGRFKLRQKLGEGGMGEVWVADQTEPMQRRVALKLVRPGHDSTRMLARFEQERQALALMDHPNIAKVLDAGIDDAGRPYFVMELIKGMPITKYCDEAKLSPRERLELFIPVCHAVQHAHQKGIIHRDLKPSNILVALYDGKPVPKVIDFGVAKATGPRLTEQSLYTEVGALIGTLEYMSPEQAELNNLDIDTRSDIYALGAILYELLTGSVPFSRKELQAAALTDMLRMIKEVDPPKPSTKLSGSGTLPTVAAVRHMEPKKLIAMIRGELDWIVLKCLEKDRSRRYATANGLARDLERYLADKVVEARPPGVTYRLRKFLRRNRRPVAATVALAMMFIAGSAAVWAVEARASRELAAAEKERAAREAWTTASVQGAIRDAGERVDEAWSVIDNPDRMQRATDAAAAALHRADEFVAGGYLTDAKSAELEAARRDVEDLARHTKCVVTGAANLYKFWDELNEEGDYDSYATVSFCVREGEALKEFGLDPINQAVEEVARAVAASRIRDPILSLLLEWHMQASRASDLNEAARTPFASPMVRERLEQTIRATRQIAGGSYARWQDLLDRHDIPGLVAFTASVDGLQFRPCLVRELGRDLTRAVQLGALRDFLRAATDRYPHDIWLHQDLAIACWRVTPPAYDEAIRHISVALAQRPAVWGFHWTLGYCYAHLGSYDLAIAEYRCEMALAPKHSSAYVAIGDLLAQKKDINGALAAYRDALRVGPRQGWSASLKMARMLSKAGRHAEASAAYREGLDHLSPGPNGKTVFAEGLAADGIPALALEVMLTAIRENPNSFENPRSHLRYNAACLAMNCADGMGTDPVPPEKRPGLRKQALDFLTADLSSLRKLADKDKKFVHENMQHWLNDDDLKSVREAKSPDRLTQEERDAWKKLWGEVRKLLEETAPAK